MDQSPDDSSADDLLDERLAADDAANEGEEGEPYIPDLRAIWGAEGARALMVVLTRRLGSDFARDVSNELASRTLGYQAGCPDDQRDGGAMETLLCDPFWDRLFATEPPAES